MDNPLVVAVCLTRNRPKMLERAVSCFRAQTYPNCKMLIWDTSERGPSLGDGGADQRVFHCFPPIEGRHIGALRNAANAAAISQAGPHAEIICHFDDDDWSSPTRIAEQVALLQACPQALCVGYREMLFWDSRRQPKHQPFEYDTLGGESWVYTNPDRRYVTGTSMCYWAHAWRVEHFQDRPHEDHKWWLKHHDKCVGIELAPVPQMIAAIHGGNTSPAYDAEKMRRAKEWRRAPEWDNYCKEQMK